MSRTVVVNRFRNGVLAVCLLLISVSALAQDATETAPPMTIQPGTTLTVRVTEWLSSDRNEPGDLFSGTLTQPVVVRGIVVARRGQPVTGRVVEAKKAGMVSGVSRLGVALTSLTLVDGQNVPIQSELVVRKGRTSTERDAAAIAGTTGLGAAIGGAVGWGEGAAIGAGAGAVAGTIGVLLTRGHSTVIYPETRLTFQITAPVTFYTDDAPQAFHAVTAEDYPEPKPERERAEAPPEESAPEYPRDGRVYYAPPYYVYPYPYPYPFAYFGYPYVYGPSFSVFFGYPRYYGYPRYFYGNFRYYGGGGYYVHSRRFSGPYVYGHAGPSFYGHGHVGGPAPHRDFFAPHSRGFGPHSRGEHHR